MTITDYYVTTDAMGSVTAILDEEGNVLERRSYDAFGEMICMAPGGTPVAESPTGLDVGFQGQIRDEVTGLYQMGYRWYNPVLGRWLSRDPVGLHGGVNQCMMETNSPITLLDDYGLYEEDGHYYTTFMVLRANGYSAREAEDIAFYSQLPDEDPAMDAREAGEKILLNESGEEERSELHDIQNYLHSLHGGKGAAVFLRRECLRCILMRYGPRLKNWEMGLLIHALADSYAHTKGTDDDKIEAYGRPIGHAFPSILAATDPDVIANSPDKYSDYIEALDSVVGAKMTRYEKFTLVRAMSRRYSSKDAAIANARKMALKKGLPKTYKPEGGMKTGARGTLNPQEVRDFILSIARVCG